MTVESAPPLADRGLLTGKAPIPNRPYTTRRQLAIGLVNNMPEGAFLSTGRQFQDLLSAAAPKGVEVRLEFFYIPQTRRLAERTAIPHFYKAVKCLWGRKLDGMIVSGTEPRGEHLAGEPYWKAFTKLIDWAGVNTISTIWSCLAAHAAVLHLDGIERQRYPSKLSGVYLCEKAVDHPIVAGRNPRLMPHSRHNGLSENALRAKGYQILTHSSATGPDIFIKNLGSLFVFLQGHPEYDSQALLREYRRDVRRFLEGGNHYPDIPRSYFDDEACERLATFRARAIENRSADLYLGFPSVADTVKAHLWRRSAIELYRNWLTMLTDPAHEGHSPPAHSEATVAATILGQPRYGTVVLDADTRTAPR